MCVCEVGMYAAQKRWWSPSLLLQLHPSLHPCIPPILTWSMISTRLLLPPVPSHGMRSPAASLPTFLSVLVWLFPAEIQMCCPHAARAAWQPAAAAASPRGGMIQSLLVSLRVTVCNIQLNKQIWRGNCGILAYFLDHHAEGRDSRSPFSFSSSFTRSQSKLAPCLAYPPSLPPSLSVATSLLSFHFPSPPSWS